jgi:predicted GIY-YIG superfamily endonuclease
VKRIWYRSRKSAENAIVYLITHPGHSAAKIGITDADGSRLKKHSQQAGESWLTPLSRRS